MRKEQQLRFRAWNGQRMVQDFYVNHLGRPSWWDTATGQLVDEAWPIMLFTGYQDINGTNVYEGDLLGYPEDHEHFGQDPMAVVFEYGVFQLDGSAIWDYALWVTKGKNKFGDPTYKLEALEVVGHIYEQPAHPGFPMPGGNV